MFSVEIGVALSLIAGIGLLFMWMRHDTEKIGKQEAANEILSKTDSIQKKQLDIASRPADSADDALKWVRDDESDG